MKAQLAILIARFALLCFTLLCFAFLLACLQKYVLASLVACLLACLLALLAFLSLLDLLDLLGLLGLLALLCWFYLPWLGFNLRGLIRLSRKIKFLSIFHLIFLSIICERKNRNFPFRILKSSMIF